MEKKAFRIALIVFCISVVITILLNMLTFHVDVEYKKVKAVVEDMEVIRSGNIRRKNKTTEYRVQVNYNGRSYRVQNLNNTYDYNKFKPNKIVDVYLSEGQIYASVNSIQRDTPLGKTAMLSVIASVVLFFVMVGFYDAYWKEKKK